MATRTGPTEQQHRQMHALWRELGYGGREYRDVRLTITARLVGLDQLDSSADLTPEQADQVIAAQRARARKVARERARH